MNDDFRPNHYRIPVWLAEQIARVVEHLREEEKHYGECFANEDDASVENHIQLAIDFLIEWLDEKGIEHNGIHSSDNLSAEDEEGSP